MSESPPYLVAKNILGSFFPTRKWVHIDKKSGEDKEKSEVTKDEVVFELEKFYYLRYDARLETPRGSRDRAIVMILSETSPLSHNSPPLRALLENVQNDPAIREKRVDEIILIVGEDFQKKKTLVTAVDNFRAKLNESEASALKASALKADAEADADPKESGESKDPKESGESKEPKPAKKAKSPVWVTIAPYRLFINNRLKSSAVQRHTILPQSEVERFLSRSRVSPGDLNTISVKDAPVFWIGGRPGDLVEIRRDSETAGVACAVKLVIDDG